MSNVPRCRHENTYRALTTARQAHSCARYVCDSQRENARRYYRLIRPEGLQTNWRDLTSSRSRPANAPAERAGTPARGCVARGFPASAMWLFSASGSCLRRSFSAAIRN